MSQNHDMMSTTMDCEGQAYMPDSGSWIGHVLPGAFMLLWGAHWALSSTLVYARGPAHYRSRASWEVMYLPGPVNNALRLAEPCIKAFGPPIAMVFEIWLGHPDYRWAAAM